MVAMFNAQQVAPADGNLRSPRLDVEGLARIVHEASAASADTRL